MTAKRNTLSIGKEGELRVIGELLRQGFMVYVPVVDTEGTDCIVRVKTAYIGIQIKTRESARVLLFDVKRFKPQDNFFVICSSLKEPNEFWVFPSRVYLAHSRPVNKGIRLRLVLGGEGSKMRERLHIYRNNFHQIRAVGESVASNSQEKPQKGADNLSGWAQLKKLYPTVKAVEAKLKEASASGASTGYLKVLENLKRYWAKREPAELKAAR